MVPFGLGSYKYDVTKCWLLRICPFSVTSKDSIAQLTMHGLQNQLKQI